MKRLVVNFGLVRKTFKLIITITNIDNNERHYFDFDKYIDTDINNTVVNCITKPEIVSTNPIAFNLLIEKKG